MTTARSRSILICTLHAVIAVFLVLLFSPKLHSQNNVAAENSPGYVFDVASIKREPESEFPSWKLGFDADNFEARGETVRMLLRYAYGVNDDQITGGPGWSGSRKFEILAKIDPQTLAQLGRLNEEQRESAHHEMVLNLLKTRFQLSAHEQARDLPVYVLSVAKNGPKLTEAKTGSSDPDAPALRMHGGGDIEAQGLPLVMLVHLLSSELGHSIVDETGLTGKYDFHLQWDSESDAFLKGTIPGSVTGAGQAPDRLAPQSENGPDKRTLRPPLPTALAEQLGLLLSFRHAPSRVVVIDRLEMPSDN
jgi:uncharacterized protein (TIGR03435 family)